MGKQNVTISLSEEEVEDLKDLVNYFQEGSISQVNRSDVFKFLLSKAHENIIKEGTEFKDFLQSNKLR